MDIELNFIERGRGEPLLLLHGNGEDHGYFDRQISAFMPYYRVIAVDTRGHGRSPRGEAPFTILQFADDLRDFMDSLGLESAHILGFSDGGNIALTFALRYPERVRKLILDGSNLCPAGVRRKYQVPIELHWKRLRRAVERGDEGKRAELELFELMTLQPDIAVSELAGVKSPTLVIAGDRDMIKDSHTRLIAKNIPDARLVILRGSHFIARDSAAEFNRAVLSFLRR